MTLSIHLGSPIPSDANRVRVYLDPNSEIEIGTVHFFRTFFPGQVKSSHVNLERVKITITHAKHIENIMND